MKWLESSYTVCVPQITHRLRTLATMAHGMLGACVKMCTPARGLGVPPQQRAPGLHACMDCMHGGGQTHIKVVGDVEAQQLPHLVLEFGQAIDAGLDFELVGLALKPAIQPCRT